MTKILVDSELLKWALRVVDTVLPDYQEYRRLSDSLRAALDAPPEFDLGALAYESLCEAAKNSKWMPPEYCANDWLADCREYLLNGSFNTPQQPEHPGCDHCNHPMFAAMRCDVCGKVHSTDEEPQQEAVAVATVRFKNTGGNAGVAWYADPIYGVLPKDGETLYVGAIQNETHPAPSVPEQEARKQLGELLAVIHGDGGHYAAEHGITKATADAIAKWAALRAAPSVPEGWHTADEQPEDGERVLCFEDYSKFGKPYKGMDCYYFREGIGFVALPDDTDAYGGITHWMRLPQRPDSETPKAPTTDDRKDATCRASDCAVYNEPAYPSGPCDCGLNAAMGAQKGEKE